MLAVLTTLAATSFMTPSLMPRSVVRSALEMSGKDLSTKKVWVTFAEARDAKPDSVISGFKYGQEIAIATTKGGKLYALANKLPPTGQPATLGTIVEGDCIVDPISSTAYSLKTGKVVGPWCPAPIAKLIFSRLIAPQDVQVFQVKKEGSAIKVLINVNAKAQFESTYWRGVLDAQGKVDGGYY